MKKILLLSWLFLQCTIANAAPGQDHEAIKATVATFVQQQTAGLPGKVAFNVSDIDQRIVLPACSKVEAFLPPGSQLTGRVAIGVRCAEPKGWHIYVPVQIRITRALLISARPLALGQIIHTPDISWQTTETTENVGITDISLAVGKVLRYSISAGNILRADMLRDPYSVKQGQSVRLSVQGSHFVLSSSGVALNNASEGEAVQIRTTTGRVISGIASEEGVVQINP